MKYAVIVLSILSLSACAQAPEDVRASYTSPYEYSHLSCGELATESSRVNSALVGASEQQNQTRAGDAAGIIFLAMPIASMAGGNVAPEIANDKGRLEAIHYAQRRCKA